MRKKRKGSETDASSEVANKFASACDYIRPHFSLEDFSRIKKRCKEDVDTPPVGSCKSRLAGIATALPCGASSLVPLGKGLKRKMGCIEVITRISGTKKVEDDYVKGETIEQGKFRGEETVHREVEIMQHLSECPYSEQPAANIIKDVMLVIKYCHDMGVVHRDIKPENILLATSGKMKLADFSLAMRIYNALKVLSGLAGSLAYVAPGVLLGNYSEKVDILSAGVLLHVLLVGVLPFQGDSLKAVSEAIKNVKLDFRGYGNLTSMDIVPHQALIGDIIHQIKVPQQVLTSLSSSCKSKEQDKNGVVDLLAVAISHVRISEPKRSRLCSPTRPIKQQCSSNLTVNNLCRAF
ncbi:Serine/threonine-protein kinase PEPKR2 [Gossypium arboreum]|uniref:Serine/threonine-protein kinase PEPKR2 n=1 Tax=Gossypium arboreum TaxID=29729 RepID=A0A0B0NL34_GOSAR|nr:Serine/threonine-protein kinase PEPKR2 [Gossypium arboreum]